jgi:hypothetical protein
MRMEAAKEVSELPMVSTSWPVHIREKLRRRKTANGEGVATRVDPPFVVTLGSYWLLE